MEPCGNVVKKKLYENRAMTVVAMEARAVWETFKEPCRNLVGTLWEHGDVLFHCGRAKQGRLGGDGSNNAKHCGNTV